MAKNYQISYILTVIDKASRTLNKVEDNLKRLDKSFEKSNARERKRATTKEALFNKQLKNRLKSETKASKTMEVIKKREIDNWAKEENRKFRQEKMRTRNNLRMQRQASREKARINKQHAQKMAGARGMATTSMAYVTAPTAAAAALSLRSAMMMEQMKIRLLTMFGKEGEKVFKSASTYAKDTAFSIKDAVSLVTDLKIGASNIGLGETDDLVQASKQIGNVLLAFSNTREKRQEAVNQLGQIAMSGQGSFRQDILVLSRIGIPIIQAIESYSGQKFKELQEMYGANLPARLIYDALLKFSTSPQIAKAIQLREESLTQGWDTFQEGLFMFSAEYGDALADTFKLPIIFKKSGNLLFDIAREMDTTGKLTADTAKSAMSFATAWGITVPALVIGSLIIQKMHASMAATAGSAALLRSRFAYASGAMSALYLTTVDWKSVFKDISEDGMMGIIKHMDVMAATALTVLGTVKAIRAAAGVTIAAKIGMGLATAGTAIAASPAAAVAAVGATAYGSYKGASKLADMYDRRQLEKMGIDPTLQDRNRERMMKEIMIQNKEAETKVETNVVVKLGDKEFTPENYQSNTKIKRNPFENPVIYNMGE